jgi:hypothetical protein
MEFLIMGKQSARKASTRDNGHLYWARKQTKLLNRMASQTMGHPAKDINQPIGDQPVFEKKT